jgi:hypothetical protein
MVVGYAISVYRHLSCQLESHSWRGVLDTTLCGQFVSYFAAGRWFSPGTPVSSTNETDRHGTTEILLKVALNTISPILTLPRALFS